MVVNIKLNIFESDLTNLCLPGVIMSPNYNNTKIKKSGAPTALFLFYILAAKTKTASPLDYDRRHYWKVIPDVSPAQRSVLLIVQR